MVIMWNLRGTGIRSNVGRGTWVPAFSSFCAFIQYFPSTFKHVFWWWWRAKEFFQKKKSGVSRELKLVYEIENATSDDMTQNAHETTSRIELP